MLHAVAGLLALTSLAIPVGAGAAPPDPASAAIVATTPEGEAIVFSLDGNEVARHSFAGASFHWKPIFNTDHTVVLRTWADDHIVALDVASGESSSFNLPLYSRVGPLAGSSQLLLVIGVRGSESFVIDMGTMSSIDLHDLWINGPARFNPTAGLAAPSGSIVALTDSNSRRTLITSVGTGEAAIVDGVLVHVTDQAVATRSVDDGSTTVTFSDVTGSLIRSFTLDGDVDAVAGLSEGSVFAASADGSHARLSPDMDAPEPLGDIELGDGEIVTGALATNGGNRFVVLASESIHVFDSNGSVVGVFDDVALPEIDPRFGPVNRRCPTFRHGVVDTATATYLGRDDHTAYSADGCTFGAASAPGGPVVVVRDGQQLTLHPDVARLMAISADGTAAAVRSHDGTNHVVFFDDPGELGPALDTGSATSTLFTFVGM
jgi:hypothetical protein